MTLSLKKRINFGIIGLAITLFTCLIYLEEIYLRKIAEFYVSTRLEHDGEILLSALQKKDQTPAEFTLDINKVHPIYQRPFSGHYYKILVNDQELLSRSLWDETFTIEAPQNSFPALFTTIGPRQSELLVYIDQFQLQNHTVTIAVGETLDQLTPMIRQAQFWSLLFGTTLLAVYLFLQYHWITFTLNPLMELQVQLKQLQHGHRHHLQPTRSFKELDPLIAEINQLIQALDERIARSRNAMGNLAHALKTPLATLQQLCDASPFKNSPELSAKISKQLELIKTRLDNELKRARIAGQKGSRSQLRVKTEIQDLISTLQQIHHRRFLSVDIQIPEKLKIAFDRQDFLEMVGNILDNAFKWANKEIRIKIQNNNKTYLTIEDDGPGCNSVNLSRLSQRGTRLDESQPGHGLGLAIAQEIATLYQCSIGFETSDLGGLKVLIMLPPQNH